MTSGTAVLALGGSARPGRDGGTSPWPGVATPRTRYGQTSKIVSFSKLTLFHPSGFLQLDPNAFHLYIQKEVLQKYFMPALYLLNTFTGYLYLDDVISLLPAWG